MSESTDDKLESILTNAIGWGWISVMDPERTEDTEQIEVTQKEGVAARTAARRVIRALAALSDDAEPPLDDNS